MLQHLLPDLSGSHLNIVLPHLQTTAHTLLLVNWLVDLNVIFSFCREIIDEKKKFCLVTNPRNKLIY